MTFPVIETTADTFQTSNATDWGTQNMPSGIIAGETLLAVVSVDGDTSTTSGGSTWQTLANVVGGQNGCSIAVFYRKADASDTLTITVDSSVHPYRLSGDAAKREHGHVRHYRRRPDLERSRGDHIRIR